MTDKELDALTHRALLDSLRLEWTSYLETALPAETSKPYGRQMRAMVADPLAWYRKKVRPLWKKALQTAAAVLITFSVAFGALMSASPAVRAAVLHWAVEWYDAHILYRYSGEEAAPAVMPQYEIAELPEGYVKTDQLEASGYVSVTYQNQEGSILYLDYSFMRQGAALDIETEGMDVSDITVNGLAGQLFVSQTPEQTNTIVWIDPASNLQFTVDGFADEFDLLHIAQSVSLVQQTKSGNSWKIFENCVRDIPPSAFTHQEREVPDEIMRKEVFL